MAERDLLFAYYFLFSELRCDLLRHYHTVADGYQLTANGLVVNQIILNLVRELLVLPNFRGIIADLDRWDVELLLDFILYVRIILPRLFDIATHFRSYSKMINCRLLAFQMLTGRRGD